MKYENVNDPVALREKERLQAQAVANTANIDYLAMMTDIEIPADEEEGGELYESEV